jgi:hypothetical protein
MALHVPDANFKTANLDRHCTKDIAVSGVSPEGFTLFDVPGQQSVHSLGVSGMNTVAFDRANIQLLAPVAGVFIQVRSSRIKPIKCDLNECVGGARHDVPRHQL